MRSRGKLFVFISAFLLHNVVLFAVEMQPDAPPLSLEDLIHSAKEKNPGILAARAEWLATKNKISIDSALPDPMGGYDLMGAMTETAMGPQKNRFMISQEVPFPVKLWQKGKMAQNEAKAAYERYRAIYRDQINKLTKLYYDLYFVDSSIEVIEEVQNLLKKFEAVAQARYANIGGAQRDVAKAQAEVSLSLEKLFMLRQQRETLVAMMNALLDENPMNSLGRASPPQKPELTLSLDELVNIASKNRQEIKEMEALVAKSEHARALAKLAYIPDVNVGFEWTRVGDGTTMDPQDGRNSWMFPLRFNIPLWQNRIIPEIREAEKMVQANKSKALEAKNTAFYEVKDAYYRFSSAMQIVELYEAALIPEAQLALSADQAGYESGKTDFLNLLDSERVYLNAKLTQVQIFTEALKSHADIVRAAGLGLEQETEERT